MAWASQRNSVYQLHQNDNTVREHSGVIQFAAAEKLGHTLRSSSKTSTSLKRKPSRNSLVWVAYDRKNALNISEIERRTCPLIGCERSFNDPELMLSHVYECLPLSKGLYRCFECGNKERIGNNHTKGCKDLHQSKGSFAKVANSLRLAKRLFSRQAMKRRPQASQPLKDPERGVHEAVLETANFPSELETNWSGNPAEIYGVECPAELGVLDDSMYLSADEIFQRGMLSELGNSCGALSVAVAPVSPQYNAAELEAYSNPTFTAHNLSPPLRQESTWRPSRQHFESEESQWHGYTPSNSHPLSLAGHDMYQARHQAPQSIFSPEPCRGSTIDDAVSPISPTDDNCRYPSTPALSPAVRSPDYGTSSDPFISPTASKISTRDNSMSSSDSIVPSLEEYRLPTTPFLDETGSDMMYADPEDMESMPMTGNDEEHLAFINSYPWYTGPNGFAFPGNNATPVPQPLIIMKQQAHQEMDHFRLGTTSPPPCSPGNSFHTAFTPWSPGSKHKCICGYEPSGKEENKSSNLKRHQRTCKKCNGTASQDPYKYICNYPHCGLDYNRRDNLLAHQRHKKHSRDFELQLIPASPLSSESDGIAFELDSREVQPKRRRRE